MSIFDFKINKGKLLKYRGRDSVVRIPDSVTAIDSYVFRDCTFVTSIIIPDSVTQIDNFVDFYNCASLTSITVGANNKNYKSVNGDLYSKDGKTLIQYAIGKTNATFTIPDGVEYIGKDAFNRCKSLEAVSIPDSVKGIGHSAFTFCTSLKSIEIPDSVTKIEDRAFDYCYSLKSVRLPAALTEINDSVFMSCKALESVSLPKTVTTIGNRAFSGCISLSQIIGLDSVTSYGVEAFAGCTSLTNVNITDKTKYISICSKAFSGCINATISVPDFLIEKREGLLALYTMHHDAVEGCKEVIYRKTAERIVDLPTKEETPSDLPTKANEKVQNAECKMQNDPLTDSVGAIPRSEANAEATVEPTEKAPSRSTQLTALPKDETKAEKGYVFISYSTKNQDYAEAALKFVKDENISAWMAPYDIPAGSKYAHVINNAIKNCSCVLLLLSEQSQASEWVEKEIERAINYKKTIISMHIDESQLNDGFSFYLGNQQIVPIKSINKSDLNIQKVLNAIKTFVN